MAKRKNAAAVTLGRKGGKARLKTMTKEQRSALAGAASNARWGNQTKETNGSNN